MSEQLVLTAALPPAEGLTPRERVALASLPRHFTAALGERPDVVMVSSTTATSWLDEVTRVVDDGARGVLITGPCSCDLERLRVVADLVAEVPVVVDIRFAYDRTWSFVANEIRRELSHIAILDSVVQGYGSRSDTDNLADTFLGQVSVLRSILPDPSSLRLVHRSVRAYVIAGEVDGVVISLAGALALPGAPNLRVDAVGLERRWEVTFADNAIASPTIAMRSDSAGTFEFPLIYESSHRNAWRVLYAAVVERQPAPYGLRELISDKVAAEQLLSGSSAAT